MPITHPRLISRLLFVFIGVLFLRGHPLAGQETTSVKVAVHVDIPQVLRLWGSAAADTQLAIADEVAKTLDRKFKYWSFTAVRFDPAQVPQDGLSFRVWAENIQKKPCRDGVDRNCRYFHGFTMYTGSKESETRSRLWCKPDNVECSDKVRFGAEETKLALAEALLQLMEEDKDFFNLLGRIPITRKVHFEVRQGEELWAVLPLNLKKHEELVYNNKVIIAVICKPNEEAVRRLTLRGSVFDEEQSFEPPPPNTGLALKLKRVKRFESWESIDRKACDDAQASKSRSAFLYPNPEFKTIPMGEE